METGAAVPRKVDEALLASMRVAGRCELCWLWARRREPHHLKRRGMGGGDRVDTPSNLASLCPTCHDKVHRGEISSTEVEVVVARRVRRKP